MWHIYVNFDCGNEDTEVWLKEALWSGTKMDPMCAPAPMRPCTNLSGKNVEPTQYSTPSGKSRISVYNRCCPATECTFSTLAF